MGSLESVQLLWRRLICLQARGGLANGWDLAKWPDWLKLGWKCKQQKMNWSQIVAFQFIFFVCLSRLMWFVLGLVNCIIQYICLSEWQATLLSCPSREFGLRLSLMTSIILTSWHSGHIATVRLTGAESPESWYMYLIAWKKKYNIWFGCLSWKVALRPSILSPITSFHGNKRGQLHSALNIAQWVSPKHFSHTSEVFTLQIRSNFRQYQHFLFCLSFRLEETERER